MLFLDLDVVIVDRIDELFSHPGEFCIIENWTQRGRGVGNSSVYRYRAGAHQEVFERFRADPAKAVREYPNSQTFLSRHVPELTFWPATWCRSFKHDCLPGAPAAPREPGARCRPAPRSWSSTAIPSRRTPRAASGASRAKACGRCPGSRAHWR